MTPIVDFGKELLRSFDLDPIYIALNRIELPEYKRARWLVAYWCFYHAGVASWMSDVRRGGDYYWGYMDNAARNILSAPTPQKTWPRGTERRHFRGKAAVRAVAELASCYPDAIYMLDYLCDAGPLDIKSVMERAQTHTMFGPWIAFKVADMLDAVWGVEVDQRDVSAFLYDSPRKSIEECCANDEVEIMCTKEDEPVKAMGWLQHQLRNYRIPHKLKMAPDYFALETIWCKHYSHRHGHYPLYKDIKEIRHGLEPWVEHSRTAGLFLEAMPKAPLFGRS